MLLVLLAALQGTAAPQADTTIYASSATQVLVERAMERHQNADTQVQDYFARIRYRLSFGFGRRRWAEVPNAAVEEQEGRVHWSAPNDLRVEILGRRARSRSEQFDISSVFDQPWFVPRSLGDSVRVFGNDFPERAALHPLAPDGPAWYHYALSDSVTITAPDGTTAHLLAIEVLPRRKGGALVAGRLWLDAVTSDVVRFSFRYVGTDLWFGPDGTTRKDSSEAKKANKIINQVLSLNADLEYFLLESKYWMPYRQVISGRVEIPWFGELVIPFQASAGRPSVGQFAWAALRSAQTGLSRRSRGVVHQARMDRAGRHCSDRTSGPDPHGRDRRTITRRHRGSPFRDRPRLRDQLAVCCSRQ